MVLALLVPSATGCPWGATGSGGASGDETPDDSAEAMVGTYPIASVASASGNCESLETTEPETPGSVRIERMETTDKPSETQLRVLVCRDGGPCASHSVDAGTSGSAGDSPAETGTDRRRQRVEPAAEVDVRLDDLVKASDARGWTSDVGSATAVDGAASARRCRLEWTSVKLVPETEGVRLERTRRRQTMALEGNSACRSETAESFGEQLTCIERTVWRAGGAAQQVD